MVKFEIDVKPKYIPVLRKGLLDFAKAIESQTAYIGISESQLRFYNVISTVNHDFHLRASLVFTLDEITSKKNVSLKDKTGSVNLTLNKVSELNTPLGFTNYYQEMCLKLVKDNSGKRSLRVKLSKSESQEMIYTNDCGIEFTQLKFPQDEKPKFELDLKSHYLKGVMDLSHKSEVNLVFNFCFAEKKVEVVLPGQNVSITMAAHFIVNDSKLQGVPVVSYILYHKFCKKLSSSIVFDAPIKIGLTKDDELYIDNNLSGGNGPEDSALGKFRFMIPMIATKNEEN
jgi:hypothetical protein